MKQFFITALIVISFFAAAKSQTLPKVDLVNLNGGTFNSSQFESIRNKPIIISFWATWCVPCINELTTINDQYADLKKALQFELYAVAEDDSRTAKRIQPLVNGKNWSFEILHDKNQALKRQLNIMNIPYTIVVKNGTIIYKHSGYVPGDEDELFTIIRNNQ